MGAIQSTGWSEAIRDVAFTNEDCDVFTIKNPADRVRGLQEHLFPKFGMLLSSARMLITEIYGFEALQGLTECWRPKPKGPPYRTTDFNDAHGGLVGEGSNNGLTFRKKDGSRIKYGMSHLVFGAIGGEDLVVSYRPVIHLIAFGHLETISKTLGEQIERIVVLAHGLQFVRASLEPIHLYDTWEIASISLPTSDNLKVRDLVITFAALFPLLRAVTNLSVGEQPALGELIDKLDAWRAKTMDAHPFPTRSQ